MEGGGYMIGQSRKRRLSVKRREVWGLKVSAIMKTN